MTLEGIERFRPEVVFFQELFNRSWAKEVQKRSGLPTLLFPEVFSGLAVYTCYEVEAWGIERLSQSPFEDYLRYALWARLKIEGKPLVIFNTHLSWKLEDGVTRQKQVEEVLDLIQKKASGEESVLAGDLNAPPESPEIQWLFREGKFRDVFRELHSGKDGWTWDNQNPYAAGASHELPDRRIDYVLTRGRGPLLARPVSCALVYTRPDRKGIWASDHFGLLAEWQ